MGICDVIGHMRGHVTCRSCPGGHLTCHVTGHVINRAVRSGDDHIWNNWYEIGSSTKVK